MRVETAFVSMIVAFFARLPVTGMIVILVGVIGGGVAGLMFFVA